MGENNGIETKTGYLVAPPLKVDIAEGQIWLDDEPRHVGQKAFRLLCALMERPEKLWTKDELIEVVWDGRSVTDAVLTTAMKELRKALDEPARNPKFIETVHGRGYRFLLQVKTIPAVHSAPVEENSETEKILTDVALDAAAKTTPRFVYFTLGGIAILAAISLFVIFGRSQPDKVSVAANEMGEPQNKTSIAVLPFITLSSGDDDVFFADGLTEEILNSLAAVPDLLVTSRTSSYSFKEKNVPIPEIGDALGVTHLVEGSVRRAGGRARITAQLVRASDGFQLWSETYDRALDDDFEVQTDIAKSVARAFQIYLDEDDRRILQRMGVIDVEAFIAFQKGKRAYGQAHRSGNRLQELTLANAYFEEAIRLAPNISQAYYLHSDLYAHLLQDLAAGAILPESIDAKETLNRLEADLSAAYEHANVPQDRLMVDYARTILSHDWTGVAGQMDAVLAQERCVVPQWTSLMVFFERLNEVAEFYDRMLHCDRLSLRSASAPITMRGRDREQVARVRSDLQRVRSELGSSATLERYDVITFAVQGNLVAAQRSVDGATELSERDKTRLALMLAFLRKDAAAAATLHDALLAMPNTDLIDDIVVAAWSGDKEKASEVASQIDSALLGHLSLITAAERCYCGMPFPLEATPNFVARLREGDLTYKPYETLKFPSKDW